MYTIYKNEVNIHANAVPINRTMSWDKNILANIVKNDMGTIIEREKRFSLLFSAFITLCR